MIPCWQNMDWSKTLREGLLSGTLAGLFSAAVLMVTGQRDAGSAVVFAAIAGGDRAGDHAAAGP